VKNCTDIWWKKRIYEKLSSTFEKFVQETGKEKRKKRKKSKTASGRLYDAVKDSGLRKVKGKNSERAESSKEFIV